MPKIQWTNLPPALRDHLFDRLRERKITVEDLYRLKLWRRKISEDLLASRTDGEGPEALRGGQGVRSCTIACERVSGCASVAMSGFKT